MTVGYLADSFDLINVRDLDLIAQADARCSRLVVGVFTDEYAEEVFGRRPVVPLSERLALVRHIRGVAEAVVHAGGVENAEHELVFVASDVPESLSSRVVEVLNPRRRTESAPLRSALAAVDREAVA